MARTEDRYAKVLRRLWVDATFRGWSAPQPNAQSLWQYLLTTPAAGPIPGVFILSVADTAEVLGWPIDQTRKALGEILDSGRAVYDGTTRLLYLPNAIHIDPPKSPNVVVHWRRQWRELPQCDLKDQIASDFTAALESVGGGFVSAWNSITISSRKNVERNAKETPKSVESFRETFGEGFAKAPVTATATVPVLSGEVQEGEAPTRADLTSAEVSRRSDLFPNVDAQDLDAWARRLLRDPDLHLPPKAELAPYVRAALRKLDSKVTESPGMKSGQRLSFVQGAVRGLVNDDKANGWASGKTDGREGVCAPAKGRERASQSGTIGGDDFIANEQREMERTARETEARQKADPPPLTPEERQRRAAQLAAVAKRLGNGGRAA